MKKKYTSLTLIERFLKVSGGKKRAFWRCLCDCGNTKEIRESSLRSGGTKTCGCGIGLTLEKHGMAGTPEYRAWAHMKERCNNKTNSGYKDYGARGIKVHPSWERSFISFYEDVGKKPSPKHSLERINNDGNYEPSNVKWATIGEQNRNTRRNRWIYHNGENLILEDWATLLNIDSRILSNRLDKLGWSVEKTLTTPIQKSYSRS